MMGLRQTKKELPNEAVQLTRPNGGLVADLVVPPSASLRGECGAERCVPCPPLRYAPGRTRHMRRMPLRGTAQRRIGQSDGFISDLCDRGVTWLMNLRK
jgi:hypothetical protein